MIKATNSVVVLASGGLDSTALIAFYLSQQFSVRALFIDFGQPAAYQELLAVKAVCSHYGVSLSTMTVKSNANFSSGEITGRNAFFVFSALLASGAHHGLIAIGIHDGSPYYDCSEDFLKDIQTIIDGYACGTIKVVAPFLGWRKLAIWRFCKEAQLPIESTYSCEIGGFPPCGNCLSCKDREMLSAL